MALLVPTVGENTLIGFMLGKTTAGNQILRLFTSNTTPQDSDTAATYTEMTGLGYTAITLTKTTWDIAQDGGVAKATYPQVTFTFTAGSAQTVYGYFVTDATTGTLLWSERFDTAKTVSLAGDQIKITPVCTLSKV